MSSQYQLEYLKLYGTIISHPLNGRYVVTNVADVVLLKRGPSWWYPAIIDLFSITGILFLDIPLLDFRYFPTILYMILIY